MPVVQRKPGCGTDDERELSPPREASEDDPGTHTQATEIESSQDHTNAKSTDCAQPTQDSAGRSRRWLRFLAAVVIGSSQRSRAGTESDRRQADRDGRCDGKGNASIGERLRGRSRRVPTAARPTAVRREVHAAGPRVGRVDPG